MARYNRFKGNNSNMSRKTNLPRKNRCRARQLEPLMSRVVRGGVVAVDCEGVILPTRVGSDTNGVGLVSIVGEDGTLLYESFVLHPEREQARPPPQRLRLGVTYNDIKAENGAQPLAKVLRDVKAIFDVSGIIVGHGIGNEINYLRGISWANYETRDTQLADAYAWVNPSGRPGLADCSRMILGEDIQGDEHSAAEDAAATMKLYLRERASIDAAQGPQPPAPVPVPVNSAAASTSTTAGLTMSYAAAAASTPNTSSLVSGVSTFTASNTGSASDTDLSSADASLGRPQLTSATMLVASTIGGRSVVQIKHRVALPNFSAASALAGGRKFDKYSSRYI